jgi:hypothetical protein
LSAFAREIAITPVADWPAIWRQLPKDCPHTDCRPGGCAKLCADYARVQKQALAQRPAPE